LKGTSVTDAGLAELAKLKGLKEVNLSFTQVTPEGVAKLTQARPGLKVSQ
ncbi:MAG: hypothetical protein JNG90_06050, partial [Planctomycetaceae bacterium]|nr:hypothetical protein [Planctomycetaceae bacterium]